MKTCSKCQISKPFDAFSKQVTGKQGLRADCKDCHKLYNYSERAVAVAMLSNQRSKSLKRGHPLPAYNLDQLLAWMVSQPNFRSLFDAWIKSGHLTNLKPSCDRIDDYKPYTLDNIQLTTVRENITRYPQDAMTGINTKSAVAVDQYTLDHQFIQQHHSYSAAARAVNGLVSNIRNVAEQLPIQRTNPDGTTRLWVPRKAYGFIWKKH